MSLLFCDSFDHYASANFTEKYNQYVPEPDASTELPTIDAAVARHGAGGLRLQMVTEKTVCGLERVVGGQTSGGVAGVAVKPNNNFFSGIVPTCQAVSILGLNTISAASFIFSVKDVNYEQLTLCINQNGTLGVWQGALNNNPNLVLLGNTSEALQVGVWTYVEFKWTISNTVGAVEVRFNTNTVLSLTNQDTDATGTGSWDTIQLGQLDSFHLLDAPAQSDDADLWFDDFYVLNQGGATNNNFLGDVCILALLPNANGSHSAWTRSTGVNQFATIDEAAPNDDTDYNETTTVNNIDTVNMQDIAVIGATIYGTQVGIYTRKTTDGSAAVAPVLRQGGTDYVGSAKGINTAYAYKLTEYDTNPATGAAFTEAEINALEVGYKKTA